MKFFDHKLKAQQETGINTMGGVNVDFGNMFEGFGEAIRGEMETTGKLSPETEKRLVELEQLTAQMSYP